MGLEYLRRDEVLKVIKGLDVVPEQRNNNKFQLLGTGVYIEIVPLKRGPLEYMAGKFLGDTENEFNPPIKEVIVEGYDNLLEYRVDGGRTYISAYLKSMGLDVLGPRKNPHICTSVPCDTDDRALGSDIEKHVDKILYAQYSISEFPEAVQKAFDSTARQHFGLR